MSKTATPEKLGFDEAVEETTPADVITAAMRLLAGRDHSRHELAAKLARRLGSSPLIEGALDELEDLGYLDDDRFVSSFIDQRCRKGFGPLRILADLRAKGLAPDRVEQLLEEADIDWSSRLIEVAEHKFGGAVASGRADMARRGRFLEQRGFPTSLIRRYLDRGVFAA